MLSYFTLHLGNLTVLFRGPLNVQSLVKLNTA